MTSHLTVYRQAFQCALASRMAYRADLFISAAIMLLFEAIVPFVTVLIYRSGSAFPGWTMYEALMIQAVFLLVKGVAFPFFFGIVWNIMDRVREGTFDLLLIKPRSILFLCIATGIDIEDLGKLVGGAAMMILVFTQLPLPGFWQFCQFGLLFVAALSVFFSFALILSGLLFKWVGNGRMWEIFNAATRFSLYPLSIFSKGLQLFLTAVIPIAMMGFFPASVLLGKPHEGMALGVVMCGVFFAFSLWFWHSMMKNHTSAGG